MSGDWQIRQLGELATVAAGNSAPQDDAMFANGTIPFFRTSDVGRIRFGDIETASDFLNHAGAGKLRKFSRGTILFPKSGASTFLNHRVMMQADGCVSSHLATITAKSERAEPRFLLYFLATVKAQDMVQDHAYPSLNLPLISGIKVPTPSLPDQRRIVGILDQAFEGIAIAKANAEKNLQNARELFESQLHAIFTQGGTNWVEMTLADVCEFENGDRGKNYPNRNEYVESGIPWINTGHIRPDGTLSMEKMNFITREKFRSLRSGKIRAGDLVYCLRGATLGKTALVAPLTEGAVASSLVIIRPKPLLNSRFLYFFLTSPPGQRLIKGFENGAAQPNLGARSVAKYSISIPSVAEQEGVVETLTEIREETQRLAYLFQRKVAALEALKKTLLDQAFTGALTAQAADEQVAEVA